MVSFLRDFAQASIGNYEGGDGGVIEKSWNWILDMSEGYKASARTLA